MSSESFIRAYQLLLIQQYFNSPKASTEIGMKAASWCKIYEAIDQFGKEFDIDNATGDRLDKIGKIVRLPRNVPLVIPKIFFGFSDNTNSEGFGDKFQATTNDAPFSDKFSPKYTDQQLSDPDYRFFIKAKIAVNTSSAYMVSDERTSIQDAIQTMFEGRAYVVDNKDMTLTLYVSPAFDNQRLAIVQALDLLPSGQGVGYKVVVQAYPGETFGFSDNSNALSFGDKFNSSIVGGKFASKVI